MSELPAFRMFLGDAELDFRLTPDLIVELERVVGQGIGGFSRRFFGGDFHHAHMLAVIRLGLIGGGASPKEAADLLATYATPRPIMEVFPVAVGVLETTMFGKVTTDAD